MLFHLESGRRTILSAIKKYLRQKRHASLEEIAVHFGREPDVIQGMLAILVRKGQVERRSVKKHGCSGCHNCHLKKLDMYFWKIEATR